MSSITINQEKLNVSWVSLQATILSSTKFGAEYDRVKVLHEIGLAQELQHDETFYIPAKDKPLDTRTNFPDGNITNFAGQRFKDLDDEVQKYLSALKEGNASQMDEMHKLLKSTAMLAPVIYTKGTKVLTFEYELALHPKEDKTFELALWAPMPTFNVIPGGQVVATIQLPGSSPHFRCALLEAEGYIPDGQGNLTSQRATKVVDKDMGLRRIVGWQWQNDPLFKVRYQYQG